jgi:hypothetical protein
MSSELLPGIRFGVVNEIAVGGRAFVDHVHRIEDASDAEVPALARIIG